MKRHCGDTKKIIWMKWELLAFAKDVTGAKKVLQPKRASPKSDEPKKVSRPIDDPSEEEQRPKKTSSNGKKTTKMAGKKFEKTWQPKKAPKTHEFLDADSDDTDDEQGPAAKHPQKASKIPRFVDMDSDD